MSYKPLGDTDSSLTDELLVQRGQKGELTSFNLLVERYQKGIFNLALRMLHDDQAAEDATQETFTSAYTSLRSFRGGNFKSWIYRIATNACYDALRHRKRRPSVSLEAVETAHVEDSVFADPVAMEDTVLSGERLRYVSVALDRLPEDQRLVVVLFDVQGFSYQEVAAITKSSIGTVKSRLSRGRAKFRDLISEQAELFPEFQRLNK